MDKIFSVLKLKSLLVKADFLELNKNPIN